VNPSCILRITPKVTAKPTAKGHLQSVHPYRSVPGLAKLTTESSGAHNTRRRAYVFFRSFISTLRPTYLMGAMAATLYAETTERTLLSSSRPLM
jgi:hypothetical protein